MTQVKAPTPARCARTASSVLTYAKGRPTEEMPHLVRIAETWLQLGLAIASNHAMQADPPVDEPDVRRR